MRFLWLFIVGFCGFSFAITEFEPTRIDAINDKDDATRLAQHAAEREKLSQERLDSLMRERAQTRDLEREKTLDKEIKDEQAKLAVANIDRDTAAFMQRYYELQNTGTPLEKKAIEAEKAAKQEQVQQVAQQITTYLKESKAGISIEQQHALGMKIASISATQMPTVLNNELHRMMGGTDGKTYTSTLLPDVAYANNGIPDYQKQLAILYELKNYANGAAIAKAIDARIEAILQQPILAVQPIQNNSIDAAFHLSNKIAMDQYATLHMLVDQFSKEYSSQQMPTAIMEMLQASIVYDIKDPMLVLKMQQIKEDIDKAGKSALEIAIDLRMLYAYHLQLAYKQQLEALKKFAQWHLVAQDAQLLADVANRLTQLDAFLSKKQHMPQASTALAKQLDLNNKIPDDQLRALKDRFAIILADRAMARDKKISQLQALLQTMHDYQFEQPEMQQFLTVLQATIASYQKSSPIDIAKQMLQDVEQITNEEQEIPDVPDKDACIAKGSKSTALFVEGSKLAAILAWLAADKLQVFNWPYTDINKGLSLLTYDAFARSVVALIAQARQQYSFGCSMACQQQAGKKAILSTVPSTAFLDAIHSLPAGKQSAYTAFINGTVPGARLEYVADTASYSATLIRTSFDQLLRDNTMQQLITFYHTIDLLIPFIDAQCSEAGVGNPAPTVASIADAVCQLLAKTVEKLLEEAALQELQTEADALHKQLFAELNLSSQASIQDVEQQLKKQCDAHQLQTTLSSFISAVQSLRTAYNYVAQDMTTLQAVLWYISYVCGSIQSGPDIKNASADELVHAIMQMAEQRLQFVAKLKTGIFQLYKAASDPLVQGFYHQLIQMLGDIQAFFIADIDNACKILVDSLAMLKTEVGLVIKDKAGSSREIQ